MVKNNKKVLLSGNEGLALGAIKAGLKFYAAYPMTPASTILHFLAAHEHDYKILVKQTEDELAAINMTIGASLAGVRAMCATSGGGFALMNEAFGFGAMVETPLVVAMVSRPGPATGMPTWSSQGDLRFVMHSAPDEFPRVILAPGDPLEAFQLAFKAFNLADKYQLPVILLSDKNLGESYFTFEKSQFEEGDFTIDRGKIVKLLNGQIVNEPGKQFNNLTMEQFNDVFERYKAIDSGVSDRSIPGTPGHLFCANSDEHDEFGYSEEDSANRNRQMEKRMRKLDTIVKDQALHLPKWYGPANAKKTLICWGSNKGSCLEALKYAKKVNVLHFVELYPLDIDRLKPELKKINQSICVESNYSGMFADYLFEKTGYQANERFVKYDGRPFFTEELVDQIR